jgi:hypothetical protein
MILPSQAVPANQQTATMPGDFVLSIPKMFSSTEQAIIRSSTTSTAVSINLSVSNQSFGVLMSGKSHRSADYQNSLQYW